MTGDPLAALRGRSDAFIRPLGKEPTTTLGTGNAVFLGGIWLIEASGKRCLQPAPSVWTWPAILGGVWVVFAGAIAIAVDIRWLMLALVGLFTLIFGAAAVAAVVYFRDAAKRKLVVDAGRRTLEEVVGEQVRVSVPAGMIERIRIERYENGDREVSYNVLAHVGFTELWLYQGGSDDASAVAGDIAGALGVQVQR